MKLIFTLLLVFLMYFIAVQAEEKSGAAKSDSKTITAPIGKKLIFF